jgi:hypothetical protein
MSLETLHTLRKCRERALDIGQGILVEFVPYYNYELVLLRSSDGFLSSTHPAKQTGWSRSGSVPKLCTE